MVRNIAGLLIAIGQGEREPEWAQEVLESRDRTRGHVTAPAEGLYFWSVDYPGRSALARRRPIRYHRATFPVGGSDDVLVRENHAFAHQDRAPHALGPRRPVDQVPGLRCGAVSRGAGAQSLRLPQVQPPHAHRRARAARAFLDPNTGDRDRREHLAGRPAEVPRQQALQGSARRRRRRPRARRMRWSCSPAR